MTKLHISIGLCLLLSIAKATELNLNFGRSNQSKSQELSASGDFGQADTDKDPVTIYNWNAGYSRTVSDVTTAAKGTVTDTTATLSAGFGFDHPLGFRGGLGYDYSNIREEELSNAGPTLSFGYRYKFEVSDKDAYRARISFNLSTGKQTYQQKFTVQRRKASGIIRPVSGDESIAQTTSALSIRIQPWEWVSLKLGTTKYSYDKDVNQFLQYLDSHRVIAAQSSGMSQALSGFYDQSNSIEFDFYIGENWEIDLSQSRTKLKTDGSESTNDRIEVSDQITDHWEIGLSYEITKAGNATATEGETTDHSTGLNVVYTF